MKSKRFIKVVAVVLLVSMMPLWMLGCGKIDKKVVSGLSEAMIGSGVNDKDGNGAAYIKAMDAEVKSIVSKISGGTWSANTLEGSDRDRTQHYKNVYKMTKAWATKKSEYYHSGELLGKIKACLKYGYENLYGLLQFSEGERSYPYYVRLDAGEYLVRSLLILNDSGKIKGSTLEQYAEIIDYKFPAPFGDFVDMSRAAYICIGAAALAKDAERIESILDVYVKGLMAYVTEGNGLYEDGSFIAYNKVASSGSYGILSFSALTEIMYAMSNTKYSKTDDFKVAQDFLYNWAVKSIEPSLWNGSAYVGTVGSYVSEADKLGGRAVSTLLLLSDFLDEERGNMIKGVVKGYAESNNTAFVPGLTSYGASELSNIGKAKVDAVGVTGAYSFAEMDKLVVLGNKYSASLSLSSDRSAKYETRPIFNPKLQESGAGVNGNGWYTGDGMLILYTNEYTIPNKYWTFVNGQRIPGTTVDSRDRINADNGNFDGVNSNAGSVVLDHFAVSSLDFVNNNSDLRSDLTAKKSVFFFKDKIVCLGAGINSTFVDNSVIAPNKQSIETIVENVFYGSNTSVATSMDFSKDIILAPGKVTAIPSALYVMKYGGIYVPADKNDAFNARLNETEGGNFLELWVDHGVKPVNATYEYCIVPSSSMKMTGFFEEFVAAPSYEVIANTDKVQAVKDKSSEITEYTFWEGAECNGYTTDFACNMIVKDTDTKVTIAISDFTHFGAGNKTGGTITLPGSYKLENAGAGVTLNGNALVIDRAIASNGQTLTVTLTK